MKQYDEVALKTARLVTNSYSSSFGLATRLFPLSIRGDIYNIYGLVRLGDEIVDTYLGEDALAQLNDLEKEVYRALERRYSTNLIVHAFQLTANRYAIEKSLIKPFFDSMRLDTAPQIYDQKLYDRYIVGSAEVVGLMCLKVFAPSPAEYKHLEPGARSLGAAFQKVNFLRDLAADQTELKRCYFPGTTYKSFSEVDKAKVVTDIQKDFAIANQAIRQLPSSARPAVNAAYRYYSRLLKKLELAPVEILKQKRIRINNTVKLALLGQTIVKRQLSRGEH